MTLNESIHLGRWNRTTPEVPLGLTENEAGAVEKKTTNECEPKRRGNPVAELPRSAKDTRGRGRERERVKR